MKAAELLMAWEMFSREVRDKVHRIGSKLGLRGIGAKEVVGPKSHEVLLVDLLTDEGQVAVPVEIPPVVTDALAGEELLKLIDLTSLVPKQPQKRTKKNP